jgi:hypothetical protein
MVTRTQVSLEAEAHRRARSRASELGLSFAEYIRRLVDRDLGEPAAQTDVGGIFGLFDSGGADIAADKDQLVDDAFRAARSRR